MEEKGGIEKLLETRKPPGVKPMMLPQTIIKAMEELLKDDKPFSYTDLHRWVENTFNIKISYYLVHKYANKIKNKIAN